MPNIKSITTFILLALFVFVLAGCGALGDSDLSAASILQPVVQAAPMDNTQPVVQTAPVQTQQQQTAPPVITGAPAYLPYEEVFISVFEQTSPAVVHINVGVGEGSGFVYDGEGHIITNNHVVAGAQVLLVTFSDGTELPAELVGTAPDADLAVIKVDAPEGLLQPLALADSDALRVGQLVVAIGSPFGLENTLTTGVISGLDRLFPSQENAVGSYNIPDIIQTDAAINPGNSGGPLLDLRGAVVGVNTAIESPVRGSSGVGFAVPSNVVAAVVPQLIENGEVETPWLGISGSELSATIAEALGLEAGTRGIAIAQVIPGGPGEIAGLRAANAEGTRAGDVIVGIDGRDIRTFGDLLGYIVESTTVGQSVELNVLRDGEVITITVTLQARPAAPTN
jgi:2-alkenal reductase